MLVPAKRETDDAGPKAAMGADWARTCAWEWKRCLGKFKNILTGPERLKNGRATLAMTFKKRTGATSPMPTATWRRSG